MAQYVVVPGVTLGGFPSLEPRCRPDGVEPAPKTGGRSDDAGPVRDGEQPGAEVLGDGDVPVVVHFRYALADVDGVVFEVDVPPVEAVEFLVPFSRPQV